MQKEGGEPLLIKCGFILTFAFYIFNFALIETLAFSCVVEVTLQAHKTFGRLTISRWLT
jgi:hypothetical protein